MRNPNRKRGDIPSQGLNNRRESIKPHYRKRQTRNEDNPVMRADEVRQIIGIGKNTIYTWAAEGKIPCKKVGRVILFSRKRFYEWLEDQENQGGPN